MLPETVALASLGPPYGEKMGIRHKTKKSRKWRLTGVLLTLCLASGVCVFLRYRQVLLVRYWELELTQAPDKRVGDVMRNLARLNEPGINAVARALGSSRTVVSEAAYEALTDEINACTRLSPPAAHERLSALAAALATHADELPHAARGAAARLAVRLLLWPSEAGLADRGRLVADCERVLQAAGAPVAQAKKPTGAKRQVVRRRAAPPKSRAAPRRRPDAESLAHLPAAALPLADFAPPELPRAATEGLANDPNEPGRFDDAGSAALANLSADEATTQGNDAESTQEESPVLRARHQPRENARPFKTLDTIAVFQQLHGSDESAAEAAAELRGRGLTIRQIEVGMHLTSPDAHERRTWTEYLPGIRGVSAKAWLLHLSRDENVAVRRAAVNLLATSGDPQMQRRVDEVARQDADPELRFEAARAAELVDQPSPYVSDGQQ